ncbi:MAG: GntR family transcriptional regulator [Phycisphaeraceae bacterium]|nr:GntR family transcriptional regulator [Phycisphaeraceae bacterium]
MKLDLSIETADPVHLQIERFLRQQIQTGEVAPGARLPTTGELARRWRVDRSAIQRAIKPLVAQGLIERSRKRGTFVKPSARKALVAVLFGPNLSDESAHFYRALLAAIRSQSTEHQWDCRLYDGLNYANKPEHPHQEQTLRNLRADVPHHDFKGFIHVALRWELTQALEKEHAPAPVTRWNPDRAETDLLFDSHQFSRRSVAYLMEMGRRRLAYVQPVIQPDLIGYKPGMDGFLDATREMNLPQSQVIEVPYTKAGEHFEADIQTGMAKAIQQWRASAEGLPDALIVGDDVAMRGVAMALLEAGITAKDLPVVTMANEGVRLHYGMPVTKYEYSTRDAAVVMLDLLWKRILGEPLPALPIVLQGTIRTSDEIR